MANAPPSASDPKIVRLARWFHSHTGTVVLYSAPFLFALCCVWLGVDGPQISQKIKAANALGDYLAALNEASVYVSVVVLGLAAIAGFFQFRRNNERQRLNEQQRNRITQLEGELRATQGELGVLRGKLEDAEQHGAYMRQSLDDMSRQTAANILKKNSSAVDGFGDHARVSLYAHLDGNFILAGRYTPHPNFDKPNRQVFPDNEGCIGQAWLNGGECYHEVPDSEANKVAYLDYLKNVGITRAMVRSLRMPSRFYYARAISRDMVRVGVVVYESTHADVLYPETLKALIIRDEESFSQIVDLAKKFNLFAAIRGGGQQ